MRLALRAEFRVLHPFPAQRFERDDDGPILRARSRASLMMRSGVLRVLLFRSRPSSAAFRLAQDVVPVSERRQPSSMDHPVQTHHQGLALDVELRLVEIADDILTRRSST